MKAKRLFFFVMAICLANGVKAQFYDSADDILYYVEEYKESDEYKSTSLTSGYYTGRRLREIPKEKSKAHVMVLNFDGFKAALLNYYNSDVVEKIKYTLSNNPSYYDEKVEIAEYNLQYESKTTSDVIYKRKGESFKFSADRSFLKWVYTWEGKDCSDGKPHTFVTTYKRVDKSYFKVGRSRTPSGTMYD